MSFLLVCLFKGTKLFSLHSRFVNHQHLAGHHSPPLPLLLPRCLHLRDRLRHPPVESLGEDQSEEAGGTGEGGED